GLYDDADSLSATQRRLTGGRQLDTHAAPRDARVRALARLSEQGIARSCRLVRAFDLITLVPHHFQRAAGGRIKGERESVREDGLQMRFVEHRRELAAQRAENHSRTRD